MGHHYNTVTGIGRNRREASEQAIADFLHEHGHRHSLRGTAKAKLLRKVPPQKTHEERRGAMTYVSQVDDPEAPLSQWLEEWEFELHTHA